MDNQHGGRDRKTNHIALTIIKVQLRRCASFMHKISDSGSTITIAYAWNKPISARERCTGTGENEGVSSVWKIGLDADVLT